MPDVVYNPPVTGLTSHKPGRAQLFPNPGKAGQFTLQLKNQHFGEISQVTITHISGKLVHQFETKQPEVTFSLDEQTVYFVKIQQGNYEEILKLLVK